MMKVGKFPLPEKSKETLATLLPIRRRLQVCRCGEPKKPWDALCHDCWIKKFHPDLDPTPREVA